MADRHFYLGGGTALALYFGHRRSGDLDWFTQGRVADPLRLAQSLRDEGLRLVVGQTERGTLYGTVARVRVSFLEYRYALLAGLKHWSEFECALASLDDLACMKLSAVAQPGSKKDFVDIYALGRQYCTLSDMLRLYQKKYSTQDIGHLLYSLSYFDDADRERMPALLWDTDWRSIKRVLRDWIRQIAA